VKILDLEVDSNQGVGAFAPGFGALNETSYTPMLHSPLLIVVVAERRRVLAWTPLRSVSFPLCHAFPRVRVVRLVVALYTVAHYIRDRFILEDFWGGTACGRRVPSHS